MFTSYITIALRTFWKDRNYSIVNLTGLVIGLASVLMIIAYVRYELSYDTNYSNAPDVYRLTGIDNSSGMIKESVMVPDLLGKTLAAEYPEIASFTTFLKSDRDFTSNNKTLTLSAVIANRNFFTVFNLPFLYGSASSLKQEKSIVISESTAKIFFSNRNPVGLPITTAYGTNLIISGVYKDIPPTIHFGSLDAVIPDSITTEALSGVSYSGSPQYVLLNKRTDIARLQNKLTAFYKKYDFSDGFTIGFQPVQSIHLHSHITDDRLVNSDIEYIYLFSAIAFLILFIACINYINLTTARSLQRTREVGVRKVMGAGKRQLAFQFLTESVLFFIITLPFAVVIAKLAWPFFVNLLQIPEINTIDIVNMQSILILISISLLAGVLAGFYPAFFLSALQPVTVLKGWKSNLAVSLVFRKGLIVLQFVISIVLIIATIVVQLQLRYINNINLGFNKENLLVLPFVDAEKTGVFKQQLLADKNIVNVSMAGSLSIGGGYGSRSGMASEKDTGKEWNFAFIDADFDFVKTLQIPVLEGRNFSPAYALDAINPFDKADSIEKKKGKLSEQEWMNIASSQSMIITKKTAELIQLPKPYVGQNVRLDALQGTVIGVIDDFKGISLKQKNPAVVLRITDHPHGNTFIRIQTGNIQQKLAFIEEIWKQNFPQTTFRFSFADEQVQKMYDSEQRLASFFGIFAVLGISIACLGLFSLVALLVRQRTKEIGIRKVLGASIKNIVQLVSADFIKPVLISIVIASPIAWWAMNQWLQDYKSRIDISWWIFALAGGLCISIALATVSILAVKAAVANPVASLRTE